MSLSRMARRLSRVAIDHSPTILTSIGVAGTITTAYLAAKASFKAARVLDSREFLDRSTAENQKEFIAEQVKEVWHFYIPAATVGFASVICIIGANQIGARRAAGLAAATTIVEKSFDEYKEKVAEKFGDRKEQQVRDEVSQDQVTRTYRDDVELYGIRGQQLCFDAFSARYFEGTVEGIRSAINTVNNLINHDGVASLGEIYRELNIPATEYSEEVGWNSDKLIEEDISSTLTPQGDQVIVLSFRNAPGPDYSRRFRRL